MRTMRALFDTNCWLWWHLEPERLAETTRAAIADASNELYVSSIVPWEIAIKHRRGKLSLRRPFDDLVPAMLAATRGVALPVERRHALQVARLPLHHHDPFDRMLIAQAQVEGLTILTADPQFRRYEVEVLAA